MEDIIPENYDSQILAEMWREFIDWEKRRKGEDNFLVNQFRKHNVKRVFDSALGEGCDSIYLLKQGFDVTSNEIDKVFLDKALENAKAEGVQLKITTLDWRKLDKEIPESSFDAVINLGNCLTYFFTEETQLKVLHQFKRILRDNGILIIDERNYQYMLDNREEILKGKFRYSGKYVYCGRKIHGRPVEISDNRIKMEYTDERTGKKGYLIIYPFKKDELKNLLSKANFRYVEQFSDYKPGYNDSVDFYQYVCVK